MNQLATRSVVVALVLATGASSQTFSDELLAGVAEVWEGIDGKSIDTLVWRDKRRFTASYEELEARTDPSPEDYEQALEALRRIERKNRKDEHFRWRVCELRARVLWDSGARDDAIDELEKALDAYPAERYPEPSKHSSYHHIANSLSGWIWDEHGVEAAETSVLERFKKDRKFQFFYWQWWKTRYTEAGDPARFDALVSRVIEAYKAKAKKDKRGRELLESYRAELEALTMAVKHTVGGDEHQTYYLLQPKKLDRRAECDLIVVLPGGNGQAGEFLPWLTSLYDTVGDERVFAVLSAPQWSERQTEGVVWVTEWWRDREYAEAEFSTEAFIRSVCDDVASAKSFRVRKTLLFGWSSSGPAVYAAALAADAPYNGALVHSSVFKQDQLDLAHATGRRFHLLQGNEDEVTGLHWAEQATELLRQGGATVRIRAFDGGHGFGYPNATADIQSAFEWLLSEASD